MTLLKDRVRIFYSMTPEQKTILIKIFRKYLNKTVCMVGISSSDMEAISLSNIGIMVGPPINYNTLFCHYYLCDKNLLEIENILISVNSIYIVLSVLLIIFTYRLNSSIESKQYILLNSSIFALCLSAFCIEPNYSIDINNLAMNRTLFITYLNNLIINKIYSINNIMILIQKKQIIKYSQLIYMYLYGGKLHQLFLLLILNLFLENIF